MGATEGYYTADDYEKGLQGARDTRAAGGAGAGQAVGNAVGGMATKQAVSSVMGSGAAAEGLAASTPVASGVSGGTVLADGSVAPMSPTGVTGPAEAAGMFDIAGIGSAGNAILPIAGLYGGYDLAKRQGDAPRGNYARGIGQGAASGAAIGSYAGPWGALIGGGVGALAGGIGAATGTTKDKDQMQRDAVRSQLQQSGFVDKDFNVTTSKGNRFNIGLDGSTRAYNVQADNPLSGQAVGWAQVLGSVIGGDNRKVVDDFTGYLANAAMSDADSLEGVRSNVLNFVKQMGLDRAKLEQAIGSMNMDQGRKSAMLAGIDTLFSGKAGAYVNKSMNQMMQEGTPQPPTMAAPPVPGPSAVASAPGGDMKNVISQLKPILR